VEKTVEAFPGGKRLDLRNGGDFRHLTSAKEWFLGFSGFVAHSGVSGTSAYPISQIGTRPIA
jgi:hypothetical protein